MVRCRRAGREPSRRLSKLIAEDKSLDRSHAQAVNCIQSRHRTDRGDQALTFVVLNDFGRIALHELNTDKTVTFDLEDLPKHVRHFGFLIEASAEVMEDDADPKATRFTSALHDALKAGGFTGTHLERTLARILVFLFDDVSAWSKSWSFRNKPKSHPLDLLLVHDRLSFSLR